MAYIYKIINLINGKIYIGKTSHTSIQERFREHVYDSKKPRCEKRPLYDAMNKYGVENFKIQEIEEVISDEIASQREQYWIEYYRSYIGFPDCNGYNATLGGDSKRYYNYEDIANKYLELKNQREVAKYFNCDVETVRNALIENNVSIISGAEYSKTNFSQKVAQMDPNTNEIIAVYNSISDAFRALNKTKNGLIGKACKTGGICLGYKWKKL